MEIHVYILIYATIISLYILKRVFDVRQSNNH